MRSRTKIAALIATLVAVVNAVVSSLVTLGVISQEVGQAIFDFLNSLWGLLAALGLGFLRDAVKNVEDKVDEKGSGNNASN